jgi:hypothetical protein
MRIKAIAVAAALLLPTPALAQMGGETPYFSWNGFRIGVQTGGFMGRGLDDYISGPSYTFPVSGVFGGFAIGIDHAFGPVVLGIGLDHFWSTIAGSYSGGAHAGSVDQYRTTTVTARIGYAFNQYLLYVVGGFNFSKITTVAGLAGGPFDSDFVTFHSGLVPGYGKSIGIGFERAFSHGLSMTVEYRFVYLGDEYIDLGPTYPGDTHFVAIGGHTIRIGFSARFGGGNLAGLGQ